MRAAAATSMAARGLEIAVEVEEKAPSLQRSELQKQVLGLDGVPPVLKSIPGDTIVGGPVGCHPPF
jgi:hypothetical protein